nr:ribonuclease H-like domain-containing protein [Tanacetum cinerariifolium]
MLDEYNALIKNGTWILVPKPTGVNMVRSVWLFKHKFHANRTLNHYKARLVANGSSQQQGIDVDETFSPVVKPATIRTVLSLARSLYGLKQAPRAWFQRFTGLFLSQKKYACELFEHANMVNCNPSRTRVDTDSKLGPEGVAICLYMHDPREPHFAALKRIVWYVWGTMDFVLQLYASAITSLVGYTDADGASCPSTRRSTFGYCVFLGDNLLSWSSKRLHTISRSSAKAEYRGVANVVAETAWLRNLLRKLHSPLSTATFVYCDNVSVVYLSPNTVQHQRTKHIEIDIHFVRDMVQIIFGFFMYLLATSMLISSPKVSRQLCLKIFAPV